MKFFIHPVARWLQIQKANELVRGGYLWSREKSVSYCATVYIHKFKNGIWVLGLDGSIAHITNH